MIERVKNSSMEVEQKGEYLYKIVVDIKDLESSLLRLLNEFEYITLDSINYRDDIEDGKFCITYCLQTEKRDHVLMVQTYIERENATLPTMHKIWAQAEIMEREMHEMLGVDFPGHPTLIDFVLEYWDDLPPLRRDFDTLEFVERMDPFRREQRDDNLDVKVEIKKKKDAKKAAKLKAEAEAKAKEESKEEPNNE
jgi:NADH-quinone oxidoreductase subunit C